MEKVLYALTRGGREADDLRAALLGPVADALLQLGVRGLQVNVADREVAAAAGLRITSSSAPADALVGVWLDSATDRSRAAFDEVIASAADGWAAYLVTESVPLPGPTAPPPGSRTDGMAQVAFLTRPAHLTHDEWLGRWLDDHTPVALATQDTFGYVQHVVTRHLTPAGPPWAGIVEELFPAAAMTDPHAFFDAPGDDERLRRHQAAMIDSTQRFLDFGAIDVIPTSRYLIRPV